MKRFGWYVPKPEGTVDIRMQSAELSAEAWVEFQTIVQVTAELRPMVIDFLSLQKEFERLVTVGERLAVMLRDTWKPMMFAGVSSTMAYVEAQGALSGFLFAASAFRDRVQRRLRKQYGAGSTEEIMLRDATRTAYDGSFAYRLFFNLRNFAQHHDCPISVLPMKGQEEGEAGFTFTAKLMLDRDVLAQDPDVQSRVRAELLALSEPVIELVPMAHEYMGHHGEFMRTLIVMQAPRLADLQAYGQFILQKSGMPKGAVPVIWDGEFSDRAEALKKDGISGLVELEANMHHFSFDELALLVKIFNKLSGITQPGAAAADAGGDGDEESADGPGQDTPGAGPARAE